MLKRFAAIFLVVLSLSLQSCISTASGLKSYVNSYEGYEFLYPNGWVPVEVPDGPDIVFHDLIEPTENVSVIISDVPEGESLEDLGSPSEVGQRLAQGSTAASSERQAELVNAESRTSTKNNTSYYLLEYAVQLPNQSRHNLASVAVRRGKLFTFNISTTERRWSKVKEKFRQVVSSFSVY
ncbi:MAG TPA: photosystem II reaction center PsbP [Elainellaceae cyanobacterium]